MGSNPQIESLTQPQVQEKNKIQNEKEKNISEVDNVQKSVPLDIINKVSKSICKIIISDNKGVLNGTGFFMKIDNNKKYLVTNYHAKFKNNINNDIILEIYNHKKMKLNIDNRDIKYFESQIDIIIIEIKNDDEIYSDIEFLDYDSNYIKGYDIYKNADVFSIGYPLGNGSSYSSGKIINLNKCKFEHNISINNISSGSPIILSNNNIDLIKVIGIHKERDELKKINIGTFIGEIFNENNSSININNNNNKEKSDKNSGKNLQTNLGNMKDIIIILIDIEFDINEYIPNLISDAESENSIFKFNDINSAFNKIKGIKFIETIIIVNEKLYVEFVKLFKKHLKDIYIIPNIIIYSSNKENEIIIPNYIQDNSFYFHKKLGSPKDIKNFIEKEIKANKLETVEYPYELKNIDLPFIFQRIRNRVDLHLSIYYKILLDISKTDNNNFKELMKKYKNDVKYKALFNPIITIPDIPIELLSKYYARIYTVDGNFFVKMNRDLLIDYNKDNIIYQSYIKTLYEGVEKNILKPLQSFQNIQLFCTQYFTENQIRELNEYRLKEIDYYKVPIIFSKLFLSFTKDIAVAEGFMNSYKNNTMLIIVGANTDFDLTSHAVIEELSCFPAEKEVLFFPFSAFGIEDFTYDSEKKIHILKLIYLGKFLKEFESKDKFNIERDELPESYFITLFQKSGLIDEKIIKKMKVRDHWLIRHISDH